jgi:hypothetical protein
MREVRELTFDTGAHNPPVMRLISRMPIDGDRVTMTGKLVEVSRDGKAEDTGYVIRIVAEYRDRAGDYQVASVAVDAPAGGEVTSAVLGIPVKRAANHALATAYSIFSATSDDTTPVEAERARREYHADFMHKQRRRHLTDDFIKRVAEFHKAAEASGAGSVTAAIELEFSVSTPQAERYVREARKRGFLPPSRRGKANH